MRPYFSAVVVMAMVGLGACVDSKSSSTDSSAAAKATEGDTASGATEVDSAALSSPSPSTNAPAGAAPPGTTRETTREANPTARPTPRDPMPPMAGETNSRHGPMTPADTLLRDSASGPRFRINSKGQVTPIKK
jgi:hypothetical protein